MGACELFFSKYHLYAQKEKEEIGIYVHIPFCKQKCGYCDFLSFLPKENEIAEYIDALQKEINSHRTVLKQYCISSIFFGGGTPSYIEAEYIELLLKQIKTNFSVKEEAEVTIEANPGTLSEGKLKRYKRAGINRLSIGLQSTCGQELKNLGRIHTYQQFLDNYYQAREIGFQNINIDLMSALPKQTKKEWEASLERIIALEPEHLSVYSLIIEENTPFFELYSEDSGRLYKDMPEEAEEIAIYRHTRERLKQAGYRRYEISNYEKNGAFCRHNLIYWKRKNYLGFGLGASSCIRNVRFQNTDQLSSYLIHSQKKEKITYNIETIKTKAQIEETMFLGLRMIDGIDLEQFYKEFHISVEEVYGELLKDLEKHQFIYRNETCMKLTEKGLDVSNLILSQFLL